MNTLLKITILLLSIVGGIIGVFYFEKTRVEPPKPINLGNPYERHLNTLVKGIGDFESVDEGEQMAAATQKFRNSYALLKLMGSENRLEPAVIDGFLDKMLGEYVRVLPNAAFSSIKKKDACSELTLLGECLDSIKILKHSDGTSAVTNNFKATLKPLTALYNDYRFAWALTKRSSYNGDFADVKTRLERANRYKEKEYLRDCGSLVAALDNLPRRISNSHYYFLADRANGFSYCYLSWSKFQQDYNDFKKAVADYRKASDVYGYKNIRDTKALLNRARKNYQVARSYYFDY